MKMTWPENKFNRLQWLPVFQSTRFVPHREMGKISQRFVSYNFFFSKIFKNFLKEKKTKNSKSTPMKRKPLLMKTKLEILDEYKKGSKLSDIARRRGLNASTVHYIINQVNLMPKCLINYDSEPLIFIFRDEKRLNGIICWCKSTITFLKCQVKISVHMKFLPSHHLHQMITRHPMVLNHFSKFQN